MEWNEDCEKLFQRLKQLCSSTPILAYADYSKPFKQHTDVYNLGIGAVLYQMGKDRLNRVIAYASRTLSKSERNYPAYKLEFLAFKMSCNRSFSWIPVWGNFDVYTDNNPLTYI